MMSTYVFELFLGCCTTNTFLMKEHYFFMLNIVATKNFCRYLYDTNNNVKANITLKEAFMIFSYLDRSTRTETTL